MAAMSTILVTGAAGFIGYHVCRALLQLGQQVHGIDNLNAYYDPALKQARLDRLLAEPGFSFERLELSDRDSTEGMFAGRAFSGVVHLAAQAGVRFSVDNPLAYIDSNIVGFAHVLEGCRRQGVAQLIYASSSSVYGNSTQLPWSTTQSVDLPISVYAATKKSNELMAHVYAHLYGLPCTGLRFFTVYGPWGRPDMAYYRFARAIVTGEPITVYNNGKMRRDFTFIDDVVKVVLQLIERRGMPVDDESAPPGPPYRLYNVGHHSSVALPDFIALLEGLLQRKATRVDMPLQPGDVTETFADVSDLLRDTGYAPSTSLETGLEAFVRWFRDYHQVT